VLQTARAKNAGGEDPVKQVFMRGGKSVLQQVPAPQVGSKSLLVRVLHSCISIGTEIAGVKMSGLPLYRRALKQPQHVRRVLQIMRDQGIKRTFDRVTGQLAAGLPIGYSAAGVVVEVGSEVDGFQLGDLVACAGAGVANHAEMIDVPVNLAVKLPTGLSTLESSSVAVGSIALQGVRRASPTLGESIAVLGLGLLGQITTQMLRVNGCRVIGVDLDADRVQLALANGMNFGINPSLEDLVERVQKLTGGFGADAVIVTAATSSSELISQAMQACRKKGRIVLVGDVGLNLNREDFYAKELDFLISCSYGPGRYDPLYEENGQDYALPYVRWTENRNMEEYLRLLAEGRISLERLEPKVYPLDQATEAYESLKQPGKKPLLVLFSYPESETATERKVALRPAHTQKGRLRMALVGAGSFAQAMHLPNLAKVRKELELHCVMSRTGSNAKFAAERFGASYATTEYERVLADPNVDLVMIATRHNLHGRMVLQALRAGKNVFVEKPLTIFEEELQEIEEFYRSHEDGPLLMVGFNRRFSPAIRKAQEVLAKRTTPLIVNYRMNAGALPADHWVYSAEGGGRNLGEACHLYDLFNALTGAAFTAVSAHCMAGASKQWHRSDNFVATVSYTDGSVCSLTYTAIGDRMFPKETMDIFADGKVISLIDYKSLSVAGGKHKGWKALTQEKGQLEELQVLADCLLHENEWPISLEQQIQATRISFEVERQIAGQAPEIAESLEGIVH
jgi:predicted dehydrogenase/threonine dehydrogenase-like Zn-dependent dehydrogenase